MKIKKVFLFLIVITLIACAVRMEMANRFRPVNDSESPLFQFSLKQSIGNLERSIAFSQAEFTQSKSTGKMLLACQATYTEPCDTMQQKCP